MLYKKSFLSPIQSPVVPNAGSTLVKSVKISKIVDLYQRSFNIDVTKYFPIHLTEIEIRSCNDTGYLFYSPVGIEGDSSLYEVLQNYPWYYAPWKWEYAQAIGSLNKTEKILEIGSGGHVFLKKLKSLGFNEIVGLELNKQSIIDGQAAGLNIIGEFIQNHAISYPNYYDVVCSFQVLEHIGEVHSFLKGCIEVLKPGGLLIISVPNNNSYLGFDDECTLNYPPHHAGRWDKESLSNIAKIYDLELLSCVFEPMSDLRRPHFYSQVHKDKKPRILYKILEKLIPTYIENKYSPEYLGFTIQVQYKKN